MNTKYDFDKVVKHLKMQYKKGPHTYALMYINGAWITSTKTNKEAHALLVAQIKHREYNAARKLGTHTVARVRNKTKALTYMQAVFAERVLKSGECSMYRLSKEMSLDKRSIKRAVQLLGLYGEDGFFQYG